MIISYTCQVAKTHFQMKKDPLDSAIFYLAMKKKSLICALFRYVITSVATVGGDSLYIILY